MKNKLYILQTFYDDGLGYQFLCFANSEKEVWEYILKYKDTLFSEFFRQVYVENQLNDKGYLMRLEDVSDEELTSDKLCEICDETYIDGDSCPRVELREINVSNISKIN